MKVTLCEGDFGFTYEMVADNGESILIQSDWDYPGTASTFGWTPELCQRKRDDDDPAPHCPHDGTDGTVPCKKCGLTQTDFISDAQDYLDSHIGEQVEDPGYFD